MPDEWRRTAFPVDEFAQALDVLRRGEGMKIQIVPGTQPGTDGLAHSAAPREADR